MLCVQILEIKEFFLIQALKKQRDIFKCQSVTFSLFTCSVAHC